MKTIICILCLGMFGFVAVDSRADDVENAGSVLRVVIPAAAFSLTYGLDDKTGRHQFYKSFLSATVTTYGLKNIIEKESPDGRDNHSFPSGHSAMAFSGASFIHRRYGLKYGAPAYAGAVFVGYSRIHADKHDGVDVCTGALIGLAGTWIFTKPLKHPVEVSPLASGDTIGLILRTAW